MKGVVLSGNNNTFEVETSTDKEEPSPCSRQNSLILHCTIKGKKLKTTESYYNPLAPGDLVEVEIDPYSTNKGQVLSCYERKNAVIRWNEKKRLPQVLASNVDLIVIVTTPALPIFKPRFIDRQLAQAERFGLNVSIVCNKYDILTPQLVAQNVIDNIEKYLHIWQSLGFDVLRVSAKTGEGIPDLATMLEGKVVVLVGQSGVGKSSLINVLDDNCVLKVGSLSKKYGKGRHTTTKGSLLRITLNSALMGGIQGRTASIIDTPGIKRFIPYGITADKLQYYFKEFSPFLTKCAFGASCTHTHEDGCAVLEAVRAGKVTKERYENWLKIRTQLLNHEYEEL